MKTNFVSHAEPRSLATKVMATALGVAALTAFSAMADALDNWTPCQVDTNQLGTYGFTFDGVAYGNGCFVTAGSHIIGDVSGDLGIVEISQDGTNWAKVSTEIPPFVLELFDITYGNGIFVAVGWDGFGGSNIWSSTDGVHWTSHTNATVSNFNGLTFGGGLFVAVGDGSVPIGNGGGQTNVNIYTSPDGMVWTPQTTHQWSGAELLDVAYGAGAYVAIDAAGVTYRSTTGSNWTGQASVGNDPTQPPAGHVSFCNGHFIALGNTGTNFVSYLVAGNLLRWSPMVKDTTNVFTKVISRNGLYVGLNESTVFTSTNGTNWIQRNLQVPQNVSLTDIAFGERNMVAIGNIMGRYPPPPPTVPVAYVSDPFITLGINSGVPPVLTVSGLAGGSYRLEYLDGLQSGTNNWQTLISFSMSSSPFTWTDLTATDSQRFYRAVLLP